MQLAAVAAHDSSDAAPAAGFSPIRPGVADQTDAANGAKQPESTPNDVGTTAGQPWRLPVEPRGALQGNWHAEELLSPRGAREVALDLNGLGIVDVRPQVKMMSMSHERRVPRSRHLIKKTTTGYARKSRDLLSRMPMEARSVRSVGMYAVVRGGVEHLLDARCVPVLCRQVAEDAVPGLLAVFSARSLVSLSSGIRACWPRRRYKYDRVW